MWKKVTIFNSIPQVMGKKFKKTSKEHKAAIELAKNRRELAKALKKEGFNPSAVFENEAQIKEEEKKSRESKKDSLSNEDSKSKEERGAEKQKKLKVRKRKARQMLSRTKKGQPIMKNIINNLLNKLGN